METIYTLSTEQNDKLEGALNQFKNVMGETEPEPGHERKIPPQAAWALSQIAAAILISMIGPLGALWQNAVPDPRP